MCNFCENYFCLTSRDNKVHEVKLDRLDNTIKYNRVTPGLLVDLLGNGEGAAWSNERVTGMFKINFCPICGKHLGNNVEII